MNHPANHCRYNIEKKNPVPLQGCRLPHGTQAPDTKKKAEQITEPPSLAHQPSSQQGQQSIRPKPTKKPPQPCPSHQHHDLGNSCIQTSAPAYHPPPKRAQEEGRKSPWSQKKGSYSILEVSTTESSNKDHSVLTTITTAMTSPVTAKHLTDLPHSIVV